MSGSGARDEDDRGAPSAAEYVLGVLSAHERHAVEQRIAREPAFAREVAFWEERLVGLAEGIAPVRPPASAWARIEAALDRASGVKTQSGLWQSLAFWRGLAFGASALAVAFEQLADTFGEFARVATHVEEALRNVAEAIEADEAEGDA
jgi:anti-sigma-K factor RskA